MAKAKLNITKGYNALIEYVTLTPKLFTHSSFPDIVLFFCFTVRQSGSWYVAQAGLEHIV